MNTPLTRRDFLRATATAAAFTILPSRMRGGVRQLGPNDKLNIAGIGVGGMGRENLRNLVSENIVALCDVDPGYAAGTITDHPDAELYVDYREMLEKRKDIDAVLIATPDHTHAVIAMAAIRAGKHVYCQKPLCHDIFEARMLARAARESSVCTQMGIQGHSSESFRLICEWLQAGAIGEVLEVDAYCSLTYYPWGHAWWSSKWSRQPTDTPPLPDKLNWDLWLGPARERAYHPAYHPMVWRCWWNFGNGMMGDRGAHTLDSVVSALKLGPPLSVEATSSDLNPDTHPVSAIITFRFPARGSLPPVKLTWYEGTRAPRPVELEPNRSMPEEGGIIFKGSKGALMAGVYGDGARLIPETRMQEFIQPAKTLPRLTGTHEQNWVNAIKAGQKAGANFEYAGPLTELCLLGNIAKRIDGLIEWNAADMAISNHPEANQYVRTEYRKGWSLLQ